MTGTSIGVVLTAISVLLILIFLSFTQELMKAVDIECREVCGPAMDKCPHAKSIPLQSYLGFTVAFVLLGIGVFLLLRDKKYHPTEKQRNMEKIVSALKGDEKKICEIIKDSGGAIFQSEIVEKTKLSKVKVSRILDKLEGKGLIERRRRGMTNLVLMKC